MKKLTLAILCSLVFCVVWKHEIAEASSGESLTAQDEDVQIESSETFLTDCDESGSGEEVESGDSSCESGESSESVEGSSHHEVGLQNDETLHASRSDMDFLDLMFLEDFEAPKEIETPPAVIEETEMSGNNGSSEITDDDDEDF